MFYLGRFSDWVRNTGATESAAGVIGEDSLAGKIHHLACGFNEINIHFLFMLIVMHLTASVSNVVLSARRELSFIRYSTSLFYFEMKGPGKFRYLLDIFFLSPSRYPFNHFSTHCCLSLCFLLFVSCCSRHGKSNIVNSVLQVI